MSVSQFTLCLNDIKCTINPPNLNNLCLLSLLAVDPCKCLDHTDWFTLVTLLIPFDLFGTSKLGISANCGLPRYTIKHQKLTNVNVSEMFYCQPNKTYCMLTTLCWIKTILYASTICYHYCIQFACTAPVMSRDLYQMSKFGIVHHSYHLALRIDIYTNALELADTDLLLSGNRTLLLSACLLGYFWGTCLLS